MYTDGLSERGDVTGRYVDTQECNDDIDADCEEEETGQNEAAPTETSTD